MKCTARELELLAESVALNIRVLSAKLSEHYVPTATAALRADLARLNALHQRLVEERYFEKGGRG